jgi:hypothetical protein
MTTMTIIAEGILFICVAYIVVVIVLKAVESMQGDE